MFQARIDRTKQFVRKNQTVLACGVTAAVTVVVTRRFDTSIMRIKDGVARDMLYQASRDNAGLLLYNGFYIAFLENKGLTADARAYIKSIANEGISIE